MAWRAWQNIAATPATLQSVPTAELLSYLRDLSGNLFALIREFRQTTTENRFLYALSVFSDKKK